MSSTPKVVGINDRPATSRQLQAQATAAAADQAAMATLSVGDLSKKVLEIGKELADILSRLERVEISLAKGASSTKEDQPVAPEEPGGHKKDEDGNHEQQ